MKRGVIMQVTAKEITVLTPDGDFIKIKKNQQVYEVGEELTIVDNKLIAVRKKKSTWKVKTFVSVVAALSLFALSFLPTLLSTTKVLAYISMDATSSIEIGITENLKVVEVKGINQEGKKIVGNLDNWKERDMEEVINEIVMLNDQAGHLKSNSNILFSTVMVEEDNTRLESSLQKKIKAVEDTQIHDAVNVEMKKATIKDREKASDYGVSTGTYLEQSKKNQSSKSSKSTKEEKELKDVTAIEDKSSRPLNTNKIQEFNSSTHLANESLSSVEVHTEQPAPKKAKKQVTNKNSQMTNPDISEKSKTNTENSKKNEPLKNSEPLNKKMTKEQGRNEQHTEPRNVRKDDTSQPVRNAETKKTTMDKPVEKQSKHDNQLKTTQKEHEKDKRKEKNRTESDSRYKGPNQKGKPNDRKQR